MAERTFWQTIELTGDQLVKTVKELIEAGNVRRIRVRQKDRTVAEFPLTIGVVGAVFAPMLAAIGALAALLTECSIDVERVERPAPPNACRRRQRGRAGRSLVLQAQSWVTRDLSQFLKHQNTHILPLAFRGVIGTNSASG